jgi:bifunctional DNA-binding transcriptional regulator/antitoxin component of YhaV-PrlF toxin-antitoxin module
MENEELRERLGMDPRDRLDIEDIRQKKNVRSEQASAMNRVLVKEVRDRINKLINISSIRYCLLENINRRIFPFISIQNFISSYSNPSHLFSLIHFSHSWFCRIFQAS